MFIVGYRLLNLRNNLGTNPTDLHIVDVMLENINEIDKLSIETMAELCNISKSKISKFVKKIGFDDYKEFKDFARNEKRRSGYLGYEDKVMMWRYIEKEGWEAYLKILKDDLACFSDTIDKGILKQLAKAIYDHSNVLAFGSVYSQNIALDFMYRLADEGKYIRTYTYDTMQEEYLRNTSDNTLVIIFSNSGQYLYGDGLRLNDHFKTYLKKTKAELALITSNKDAANNSMVRYPILYSFSSNVQSHMLIERFVMEMIILEYKKIAQKPGKG